MSVRFDRWLSELEEDVIQGEYGYEPGEFTVYPDHWLPMFRKRLTPAAAFRVALDEFGEARKAEDAAKAANWARIQAADALAIANYKMAAEPTP